MRVGIQLKNDYFNERLQVSSENECGQHTNSAIDGDDVQIMSGSLRTSNMTLDPREVTSGEIARGVVDVLALVNNP